MEIERKAYAGTMESSDIMVMIEPSESTIEIELNSVVEARFGDSIRKTIREVLETRGIRRARIQAYDRGALDCTIRARVETAVNRAVDKERSR
jgi:citrate lyase subunit gamma (acyl carrier protein)